MESLLNDLRYTVRGWWQRPVFTLAAVFTLALGISVNTVVFSIVDTLLRRPLPYADSERVAFVLGWDVERDQMLFNLNFAEFLDLQQGSGAFEKLTAYRHWSVNWSDQVQARRLQGYRVTDDTFAMLGVEPWLGRDFAPDDVAGQEPVVILSHRTWKSLLGADPSALGRQVRLNGQVYRLIGVMPEGFEYPQFNFRGDLWSPLDTTALAALRRDASPSVVVTGRLKPDTAVKQAQASLDLVAKRRLAAHPELSSSRGARVFPMQQFLTHGLRPALLVLTGAVALVLLIACFNVASLMLGRSMSREREIAVRRAMGAGRGRLVRQFLTESSLLALLGGGLGVLLAWTGVFFIRSAIPSFFESAVPALGLIGIDWRVLAFAVGVSLLTGVLFGTVPALRSCRIKVAETLKEGRSAAAATGARTQRFLVTAEVAFSLALLVSSGLLIRTFLNLKQVDPGFDPSKVLAVSLDLPQSQSATVQVRADKLREILVHLENIPGVVSAGAVNTLPFSTSNDTTRFVLESDPPGEAGRVPRADYRLIAGRYFDSLKIPLRQGRFFRTRADGDSEAVAIVNQAFADRFMRTETALGQRVRLGPLDSGRPWRRIIGVVGNIRHRDLTSPPAPEIYLPALQVPPGRVTFAIRTAGELAGLSKVLRREMRSLLPGQPLYDMQSMDQRLSLSIFQLSFPMKLMSVFALLALILAAVGIYGVMGYLVSLRPREFGVRMALGATSADIVGLVVRQGMLLVLAGLGLGTLLALALARLLQSLLFQVAYTDWLTFVLMAVLLAATALTACYLPVRRMLRKDPVQALRSD